MTTVGAVELVNVSRIFDRMPAVDGVSLDIPRGHFFSLLGPSGCGKTTILRMIAGFEHPTSGQVLLDGKDVSSVPAHRRPVNMVFQNYALFPHLTVFENVAFGLKVRKACPAAEIPGRVSEALALVRLSGLDQRLPKELSGGQQQRVAFARAIVNRPAVLLLDEPLSALDPKTRQDMQEELARFNRELDTTFIMVTHDQSEALALSHRIAVLRQGRVEQIGTPEEVFERPQTRFVADFIGQTNLLDGVVVEVEQHREGGSETESILCRVKVSNGVILKALAPGDTVITAGGAVTVWIRADRIHLSDTSFGVACGDELDATVAHVAYQGAISEYRLELSGELSLTASCRNESGRQLAAGSAARIHIPPGAARILPQRTDKPARMASSAAATFGR